jgi:SAM-dependent methyltransferase
VRLFAHGERPFDRIIPFEAIAGKRVLEIGCGMGLHSELMARAGAEVTAVDISPTSVAATEHRAALKGLPIDVRRMDAVALDFPDRSFDFVWSWGAIHHSSRTGRIVRQMHRVLKPGGEARAMVYNLNGMVAYVAIARHYLWRFWRGKPLDECLWESTDGYMARFYTPDLLADAFATFFDSTRVQTFGQDADAVPLPRRLRTLAIKCLSEPTLARWANTRGAFLFVAAGKAA